MTKLGRLFSLLFGLLYIGAFPLTAFAAQGRLLIEVVHSRALEGNQIGDTPDRQVTIYLPPSYDHAPDQRYPVVYLLHGATSDPKEWFDGTYQGMDLSAALDRLAAQKEFIVVMPAANNRFGGTFYVNSQAFGRWEDFITKELVRYVDAHYRTLPTRNSRGLAGQSMGGFGALYLAGRHADTFGHVYATSPCCLALVGDLANDSARWQHDPGGWLRAMGMAFAPASQADIATATPPLPFVAGADGQMQEVPAVMARWQQYLPLSRLTRDPAPYRRLCSLALDAGRQDQIPSVPLGAAAFSRELTRDGIANTFVEFEGTHTDHARERFETAMMPFFAQVLAAPGQAGACRAR